MSKKRNMKALKSAYAYYLNPSHSADTYIHVSALNNITEDSWTQYNPMAHTSSISHAPSQRWTASDSYQPHNPLAINLIAINGTRRQKGAGKWEKGKWERGKLKVGRRRLPKSRGGNENILRPNAICIFKSIRTQRLGTWSIYIHMCVCVCVCGHFNPRTHVSGLLPSLSHRATF